MILWDGPGPFAPGHELRAHIAAAMHMAHGTSDAEIWLNCAEQALRTYSMLPGRAERAAPDALPPPGPF